MKKSFDKHSISSMTTTMRNEYCSYSSLKDWIWYLISDCFAVDIGMDEFSRTSFGIVGITVGTKIDEE